MIYWPIVLIMQPVQMVTSDCKVGHTVMKVVLRFVTMESGGQCVMTPGEVTMPTLCAGSLDTETPVCYNNYSHLSPFHSS